MVNCLGSLVVLVLGILLCCFILYAPIVQCVYCWLYSRCWTKWPEVSMCVWFTLSCVSCYSYLRFIVVCCGTMGVLLLSYIYLFTKCSLLFVIRIERGAPASSIRFVVLNSSRGIQTRLVVFKFALWYLNPSRGIQTRLVVSRSVSWYLNPSRGISIRLVVFKSVSWYSNPSRGIQIRLVVFNPSRGIQISFVVFKSVSWYSNP